MKKNILITGANSYVGTNVEKWLMKEPDKYHVETLDMKDPNWKAFDFSKFDVVFHVAGIAHVSKKKSLEELYYKVNRDLTIETAQKAKDSGVKQFIFMSSMIVYNSKETVITKNTKPNPDNFYGQSKLDAENGLLKLESQEFKVSVLRPPMIYGPGSKGNFPKLVKLVKKAFIFPNIQNKRSMLYIDNLSKMIEGTISNNLSGILFPQNPDIQSTTQITRFIRQIHGKRTLFTKLLNPFIYLTRNRVSVVNKLFSDSYYESTMSIELKDYCTIDMASSLKAMFEKRDKK